MYLPTQFKGVDTTQAADLIRAYPLASLISVDDEGFPFVSHLPLHLQDHGQPWRLLGHVARGNTHWRYLQARPKALVTFFGPHAYLTPKIYPDLTRVPSWNYLAVHCEVEATLVDLPQDKDALLKYLIADHEPSYADQWRSLDEGYTGTMLAGIVAFELRVTQLACKLKLNQHRPESHAKLHALYAAGNDHERALARWMERLGMVAASQEPNV
jgi:transcriptional regulator